MCTNFPRPSEDLSHPKRRFWKGVGCVSRLVACLLCMGLVMAQGQEAAAPETLILQAEQSVQTLAQATRDQMGRLKKNPTVQSLSKSVSTGIQKANRAVEQRKATRAYIQKGMRKRPEKPVMTVANPEKVLGTLPRFDQHPYYDAHFQSQLDLETDSTLTAGNVLRLLPDGTSWVLKRELIRSARETLYISTMMLTCDEGGKEFSHELIQAAQRGVDTRLILDAIFSFYGTPCLAEMRQGGVQVIMSTRSLRPDKLDWEMHEKHMIVDGEHGITGGQNIGSWYQDATGFDENLRDTDLYMQGPIVTQLGKRFVQIWREILPEDRSIDGYAYSLERQEEQEFLEGKRGQSRYPQWLAPDQRRGLCRLVTQDPHLNSFHVWTLYQRLIENAQRRVMLTAYALEPQGSPTQDGLRRALIKLAQKPSAEVDLITNGYGVMDNPMVPQIFKMPYGAGILRRAWKGFGKTPVRVFVYHYFTHAKQYYFDGVAAAVGSFNYDSSGNRCQESTVVCMDPSLVGSLEQLFARDVANSWVLSGEDIERMEKAGHLARKP